MGSQLFLDSIAWLGGIPVATLLRYEFEASRISWISILAVAIAASIAQVLAGHFMALYKGRYQLGAFEEVRTVTWAASIVMLVFGAITLAAGPYIKFPRSIVFIAFPFVILFILGTRYVKRVIIERGQRPSDSAEPALIYGAGFLGDALVRRMIIDPTSKYRPVGFIDDDPELAHLEIRGVHVLGSFEDLAQAVKDTGANTLVVAIGYADAALLRRVSDASRRLGISVKVLPVLNEVLQRSARLGDLRSINIEDLISRPVIDTDIESIAGYLTGKRVLVTGAGGSIGSELCRQIHRFGPSKLILLDRDETGIQETQITLTGRGLLQSDNLTLCDIRDPEALGKIFEYHQPQVVFHAAALKHLPLLERYPEEAWKTNVLGTLNTLEAARSVGVETFVNVSTDKAANPTSVLGNSKRLAEKLTAWFAQQEEPTARYVSVRFGNVIGSRGSMLPTFTRLIEDGGPVTVTHPEVTRYFMTIPEACELVMQAGGIGRAGEVLILDMGEPIKILDIAEQMIEISGKAVEIVFTGLRPGEKLHEDLIAVGEHDERPFHPKISHTKPRPIPPESLDHESWVSEPDHGGIIDG